jgi:hypothetical protein
VIRSAPPAPVKTALITLLIAIAIAVMAAGKADARDANWKPLVTIDYGTALTEHRGLLTITSKERYSVERTASSDF